MVTITVTSAKKLFSTRVKVRIDSKVGYMSYEGSAADVKAFLSPILAELTVMEIPYKVGGESVL